MHENKQAVMDSLVETLRLTSAGRDLVSLEYDRASETVQVVWEGGLGDVVNVNMDSGAAMILDVMKHGGIL